MSDLGKTVVLFGKLYHWDLDPRLDRCSVISHCFVMNKHTEMTGCRRPAPQLVLRHGKGWS